MKFFKILVALSLAVYLFASCQKEQVDFNEKVMDESEITLRIPFYGDIIAIFPNEKPYYQNGCIAATNEVCHIADTYPYPWLWDYGGPDFIFYFEVAPSSDGSNTGGIILDEGSSTSLVKCSIYESRVDLQILKYSDNIMYEENEWVYTIYEDSYLKFGETSTVGDNVGSVLLKAGSYEIIPDRDEGAVGTVSIDAVVELL